MQRDKNNQDKLKKKTKQNWKTYTARSQHLL